MAHLGSYVVLDIETTPIDFEEREILDYLIRKDLRREFHPFFSKAIAVAIKEQGESPSIFIGDDEKKILSDFRAAVDHMQPRLIVTFNGIGFDVPFLTIRSFFNGMKPTFNIETSKWHMESCGHFDCMQALCLKRAFPWVSQEIACRLLGIPIPKDRVKGDKMQELYKARDWDAIRKRASQDLDLTEQLFLKIRPLLG